MKNNLFFYISLAFFFLVGCAKEPVLELETLDSNLIPLNIGGSITQVATKATAAGFVDKDAVGLFAVNYSENNTIAGTLVPEGNQADNVKYVFDEPNYKWVPVKPVYYKDINTHVDLYLYYPYQSEISSVSEANFEVKKDQSTAATTTSLSGYEASDWLWGKAVDITPSESRVQIPLTHRLSAVLLTLNEGTGFDEGEFAGLGKSVILTNTTRKATLDYATGSATPVGNPQLDGIVMCPQMDGSFRAVVIPQSVEAGMQLFAITVNGISYSFKQSEIVTYQAGKQLSVAININKKTLAGEYELELASAQIVDWTEDLNTHGGEARQYFVVNVETPGTLGDVIASMEKNPAKIRNIKVTGTVNADDFYFMKNQMTILEAVNMRESQVVDNIIPSNAFSQKKSLCYFVFPEHVEVINGSAFRDSNLSGNLILPEGLISIGDYAFYGTRIARLSFSNTVTSIGNYAFSNNGSLTGELLLPPCLSRIGNYAFSNTSFKGNLHLPESIETLGNGAFEYAGSFWGNLIIPEKITSLGENVFHGTTITGSLDLNNVTEFITSWNNSGAFGGCSLSGELIIPEGVVDIPAGTFYNNLFTAVYFPTTLKTIGGSAFMNNPRLEVVVFNEGLISIGAQAFGSETGNKISNLVFPSTLQTIGARAFNLCYHVSAIVSKSIDPPTVQSDAFKGVPKDNFTVEVPSQSVVMYQTDTGWSEFKRFSAYYGFSISRRTMRALNKELTRSFTLRAPSDQAWSIGSKPDWVSVSPDHGVGKTIVTVTAHEMSRSSSDSFEINDGTYNNPEYKTYYGRSGDIVFKLNSLESYTTLTVEQYDCDYSDGSVCTLNEATKGNGINVVLIGDGYDAKDIVDGRFDENARDGFAHLFDIEPYKSYKEYFNVYYVSTLSPEHGIGTLNTVLDTRFDSYQDNGRILIRNHDDCFEWARTAVPSIDFSKSLIVLLMNNSSYAGQSYLYDDGSAIACCPVSTESYPYDFRGVIQHEAGGVSFAKLGKESINEHRFIEECPFDHYNQMKAMKEKGWFKNLEFVGDMNRVGWSHLIFHPNYSNYVDIYEGGFYHSRGVYRSEATSCMNNNIPYYSAISRQAIVERIMSCAGESFSLDMFYENDNNSVGPTTRAGMLSSSYSINIDAPFNKVVDNEPILIGEHPNVK